AERSFGQTHGLRTQLGTEVATRRAFSYCTACLDCSPFRLRQSHASRVATTEFYGICMPHIGLPDARLSYNLNNSNLNASWSSFFDRYCPRGGAVVARDIVRMNPARYRITKL